MIRSRLTFSNVIAMLALCLSLGGVSYAAASLPDGSIGTRELARKAVTGKKLAPKSVHRRNLAIGLRRALTKRKRLVAGTDGLDGARGLDGTGGPTATRDEAGPAGVRIHYAAAASANATPQTAVDYAGLRIRTACVEGESDGEIGLHIYFYSESDGALELGATESGRESEDGEGSEGNEDPSHTDIFKFALTGGKEQFIGGPRVDGGEDRWNLVTGLYVTADQTTEITMSLDLDAEHGTCAVEGTAFSVS